MEWDLRTLLNRPIMSRGLRLGQERVAARTTAYIYGNILALAALIPVTKSQESLGAAIVIGTALSTYIAHTFAESVGESIRNDRRLTTAERIDALRDSVPILTSAVVPVVILAAAWFNILEPRTAQLVAEIVLILRIGSTSYVISRLHGEKVSTNTHLAAFALAAVATVIVGLKVILTH